MRLAVRRMVGVGGATSIAIGAALVLALPASAHTPSIKAWCNTDNKAEVQISLRDYDPRPKDKNTVELSYDGGSLLATTPFSKEFLEPAKTDFTVDGSAAHTFTMHVFAQDDADGSQHGNGSAQQWDGDFTVTSPACVTETTTTTPPTTTTTAPPTTTTTAPSTTTGTTAPPSVETTTAAVVAATTTTPGSGSLPFTGVNTALPLGIAGLLVVAGGGILFWLRFNARRRHSS